ncbi:D-glucuronyl C5-epimerase family protein [Acidobacteria bacterium AH-259-A15]|nr:D-glucuronyl C5-epimerase family protein [Acidobacteria bacterium AH-259-A15]
MSLCLGAFDETRPALYTERPFIKIQQRFNYYRRILTAYLTSRKSHLTFWHEVPEVSEHFRPGELGEYYMPFTAKADYAGQYDSVGIPLLDYHGTIGLQYNPIAIAQYGLGNYSLLQRTRDPERRLKFLAVADWLVANLEQNLAGLWVWNHHFDWEYRTPLRAPWYSALAQGQGISVLVRAHRETDNLAYLEAAQRAFETFLKTIDQGGVTCVDGDGSTWFEEAIVDPPTHILNGFIWGLWGVYDYYLYTRSQEAEFLFAEAVRTLRDQLHRFDAGFWSLYEQSGTRMKMLASPFYHHLHIAQLRVMHKLTGESIFADYGRQWELYRHSRAKRTLALAYKALFKLLYY